MKPFIFRITSLIFLFFLVANTWSQVEGFTWFNALQSGEGRADEIKRIRTASNGDIIVCGVFRGVKDFDPGSGKLLKSTSGTNTTNPFVARYSPTGDPVWVRHIRTSGQSEVNGLDVDAQGNIYVAGYFNSLLFPVEEDPELFLVNNPEPNSDMWMLSYTENGDYRWGQMIGGVSVDNIEAVAISDDRLIIGGQFSQTVDLDPGDGVFEVTTGGSTGQVPFVAAYNKDNGSFNWGFDIGGSVSFNRCRDIAVDSQGNLFVTGAFRSTKDFNPDPDTEFLLSSSGGDDVFIASYTPQGAFRWANRGGASGADTGIAIHWAGGRVYLTGEFRFTSNFSGAAEPQVVVSAGNSDMFLATYDGASGELLDLLGVGGSGNDSGEGVTADNEGNVVVAGYFTNEANFAPFAADPEVVSGAGATGFVVSYNDDGDLNWVNAVQSEGQIRFGGVLHDDGELRSVGRYSLNTDFDPSEGVTDYTTAANSNTDFFVATYQTSNGALSNAFSSDDQLGGTCETNGLVERNSGGIVASGTFRGTMHLPNGGDLSAQGNDDAFLVAFDAAGELLETAILTTSGTTIARDLTRDDEGNIYFVASFVGEGTLEAPNTTTPVGPTGNQSRMIVVKFNENLEVLWHRMFTGSALQIPTGVATFGAQVAITGSFRGTTDFSDTWSVTSNGNDDVFLLMMNTSGDVQWAYGFGSTGVDLSYTVGFDAEGNVLMGSSLRFTVNLDPAGEAEPLVGSGSNRTAFSSYTPNGDYRWSYLHGTFDPVRSFAVIDENRFAAYGQFTDGLFTTDEGEIQLTSLGQADLYLAIYQNSGVLDTVVNLLGGPQNEEAWRMSSRNGLLQFSGQHRNGSVIAFGDESIALQAEFGRGFYATLDVDAEALTLESMPDGVSTTTIRAFVTTDEAIYVGGTFSGTIGTVRSFASTDAFVGLFGEPAPEEPQTCAGDFDDDGQVGTSDLLLFLAQYGCQGNCFADLTGDGVVGVNDLLSFLALFGTFCD